MNYFVESNKVRTKCQNLLKLHEKVLEISPNIMSALTEHIQLDISNIYTAVNGVNAIEVLEECLSTGIKINLMPVEGAPNSEKGPADKTPNFHLPPSLDAWFVAPKGHYKNPEHHIDIENPDYFVTWDVVKKKDEAQEGQQEWWEWHPRTAAPKVN